MRAFSRHHPATPMGVRFITLALCLLLPLAASAAQGHSIAGIPLEFILFGITLLGVALFHHHTLAVGLTGLVTIATYKVIFTGFAEPGLGGLVAHFA
ncbi:MAG: hypothetical protein RL434_10, partial [Pseudomonadota bacterium]